MSTHYRVEGPGFDYCPTCDADNGGIMGLCVWPCKPHLLERIQAVRGVCDEIINNPGRDMFPVATARTAVAHRVLAALDGDA